MNRKQFLKLGIATVLGYPLRKVHKSHYTDFSEFLHNCKKLDIPTIEPIGGNYGGYLVPVEYVDMLLSNKTTWKTTHRVEVGSWGNYPVKVMEDK